MIYTNYTYKIAQNFEDYKSKYLDLYDKAKSAHLKEKVSILKDVDFELNPPGLKERKKQQNA